MSTGAVAACAIGIGGYLSAATQTDAGAVSIPVAVGAGPAALIIGAVLVMLGVPADRDGRGARLLVCVRVRTSVVSASPSPANC